MHGKRATEYALLEAASVKLEAHHSQRLRMYLRQLAVPRSETSTFQSQALVLSVLTLPGTQLGFDDYTIYVAMLLLAVFSGLSVPLANAGLGKDIWTIPFDNITFILLVYFADELIYLTIVTLTKVSILFFFLRIFPKKSFRKMVYILMTINGLFLFSFIIVSVFQCTPIDYAWHNWHKETRGVCRNVNAQGWAAAIINIVLDLATILLPLRQISQLVMNWKQKVQLVLMFCVGGFVTIVSVIRLEYLINFANSKNPTWDLAGFGVWSTIELDVGVMCACMPAIQSLCKRCFPKVFGMTTRGKSTGKSGVSDASASNGVSKRKLEGSKNSDRNSFIPLVEIDSVKDTASEQDANRNV
ncbi:predicted protein [Plenodomus lingam JN3]|uniref:Predicted protein n=1 Tax=Leptosphaeria maculans (strain JN3 / isolate v23.1.3 / race Av1-4-5-6-7-8) TaxID=985895 RepID=E4ZYD2_LEPMJ|nr:predicted protein [Plenodomus lingam JN3]CBX96377.1 predicted protein [Plenodomus lingam JN3]